MLYRVSGRKQKTTLRHQESFDVIKSHRSYKCGIKPGNIFVCFLNLKSSTVDSKADINKKVPVGKLAYPKLS